MKNPTILKGELSLLRADKSAVLTELRNSSKALKKEREEINKLEQKREGVKAEILENVARLDIIESRAISVKGELATVTQELKNRENQNDISKQKKSQEEKLHLGRIRSLKDEEEEVIKEIGRLKSLFDKNSQVFNSHESERTAKLRVIEEDIANVEKELAKVKEELKTNIAQDSKLTKERLKREDKLRLKEKNLDAKELSLTKREEDLITMSKDMTIVYGRLRELYNQTDPKVDLDKLILQAL